jgi:hypothetical protein
MKTVWILELGKQVARRTALDLLATREQAGRATFARTLRLRIPLGLVQVPVRAEAERIVHVAERRSSHVALVAANGG